MGRVRAIVINSLILCVVATGVLHGTVNDTLLVAENIKLTTYVSDASVKAFGVTSSYVWYATDQGVSSLGTTRKELKNFSTIGDLDATGINDILVQKNGAIWFAGSGGVAMLSGSGFKTHQQDEGVPGSVVNCLAEGGNGTVWIGTDKGAAVFSNGKWETYTKENGLAGNEVYDIVMGAPGEMWFGTDRGISVFSKGVWAKHDMKSGLSWNKTNALAYDERKKILWAAVDNGDVNSYDGSTWRVYMSVGESLKAIMPDTRSRIWFGGQEGVVKYNGEEWIEDSKKHGIPATQVCDMLCDSEGNLWFGGAQGVMMLTNPYPF